jgi:hypothetical protein
MKRFPILVLLASLATAHGALVAHWSFDSDFTADNGGSAFDLTAVNGAAAGSSTGKFGNAASFTRASSQYAFTSGNVLTANNDFSYSAWYNFTVANITDTSRYFVLETTAGDSPSNTEAWTASVGLRDLTTATAPDDLQIFTSPSQAVGTTTLTANVWQNVIVTYDADGGSTSNGILRAYFNGSTSPFATLDNITTTAVGGLVIGGHRAGTGRNFQGLIDDIAFFDHVLTTQQISDLQTMSAPVAVPEPAVAFLAGLGILGILRRRR